MVELNARFEMVDWSIADGEGDHLTAEQRKPTVISIEANKSKVTLSFKLPSGDKAELAVEIDNGVVRALVFHPDPEAGRTSDEPVILPIAEYEGVGAKRQWLTEHGFTVGVRREDINPGFSGVYMVTDLGPAEPYEEGAGWSIVGNNLKELIDIAYSHFIDVEVQAVVTGQQSNQEPFTK
jgi:hypothetical protein